MERDNRLIAPEAVRSRFTRAIGSYDRHALAQQQITAKAAEMLQGVTLPSARCLEIGCGTGGFTRHLQRLLPDARWTLNDLCEESLPVAATHCPRPPRCVAGDAECTELGAGYGLIASASTFQWFHRPEAFATRLAQMQEKQGVLLFTTFAPGNLQEVMELTGKGLAYPSADAWLAWLMPWYEVKACCEEEIRLTFDTPTDVLRHLKQTGVTATASGVWTRGMQEDFCRRYRERFGAGNNDQVTLTYRPLYVLAVRR